MCVLHILSLGKLSVMNEFEKFAFLTPQEKNTSIDGKERGMDSETKGGQKLGRLEVGSL